MDNVRTGNPYLDGTWTVNAHGALEWVPMGGSVVPTAQNDVPQMPSGNALRRWIDASSGADWHWGTQETSDDSNRKPGCDHNYVDVGFHFEKLVCSKCNAEKLMEGKA
jgi:hypothetical protein